MRARGESRMTPKFLAQATGWLVPFTGIGNIRGRGHWEGLGEKKIAFRHTGFENPLRNLSGGIHKASTFMNRELREKIRDEPWIWEPSE